MWHPSRPKILAFKYRLTQVGKKGNFLRIKSVFFFFPLSLRKIRSVQVRSSERDSPCSRASMFSVGLRVLSPLSS